MTEREAMTQVHTDEAPFIAGEILTQKEAEEEFGTDWNPPYCWPAFTPKEKPVSQNLISREITAS